MPDWRNPLILLDSRVRGNDGGGLGLWWQSEGNRAALGFWKAPKAGIHWGVFQHIMVFLDSRFRGNDGDSTFVVPIIGPASQLKKRMEFPAMKMPSKMTGHTPAAREGVAGR